MKSLRYSMIFLFLLVGITHAHPHGFLRADLSLTLISNTITGTVTASIDNMNAQHLARGYAAKDQMKEQFAHFLMLSNNDHPVLLACTGSVIDIQMNRRGRVSGADFRCSFTGRVEAPFHELQVFFIDDSYYFMTSITHLTISTNSSVEITSISDAFKTVAGRMPVLGRSVLIKQQVLTTSESVPQPAKIPAGYTQTSPTIYQRFGLLLQKLQEQYQRIFSSITDNRSAYAFLLLTGLSILWGILHALGPGHSKTLIASYVLNSGSRPRDALLLSGLISLMHTGGAVLLGVILQVLSCQGILPMQINQIATRISGGAILIIGLYLACSLFRNHSSENPASGGTQKRLFMVAVAGGIIPCPMSLLILIFSIATQNIPLGIYSIFLFGTGMFITDSAIGLVAIKYKLLLLSRFSSRKSIRYITLGLRLTGIVLICIIGLLMLSR